MTYYPLKERINKTDIVSACVSADTELVIPPLLEEKAEAIAEEIAAARERGASVICAFGAHAIKNGLGKLLGEMLSRFWFTHLATNGAAVIHDWEFSFLGKSCEDVRENVARGCFGTWEETGLYINLALALGAYKGLGYGASVGAMITGQGLSIPARKELLDSARFAAANSTTAEFPPAKAAAALDLYELIETEKIPSGFLPIPHPWAAYSLLATAAKTGQSFTCHPMFGHDIIYTHRANRGAAIGRTAERDFLKYVNSVAGLEGGVYLSVGSAVMSPMIFEKALSMVRNAASGAAGGASGDDSGGTNTGDKGLHDCGIHVVDLQESTWDWSKGEPPMDNPAYYLRYMKTFSRMGMRTEYIQGDNKKFFVALYRALQKRLP